MAHSQSQKRTFRATASSHFSDEEAQVIGEELDEIRHRNGCVKTDVIVEEASDESSRLHKFFTWDDTKAAHNYRKAQARRLARSVVVYYKADKVEQKPIRAFYNVIQSKKDEDSDESPLDRHAYVSLEDMMSNEDYREQVVTRALNEARTWSEKYEDYQELGGIVEAIDETTRSLEEEKGWAYIPRDTQKEAIAQT